MHARRPAGDELRRRVGVARHAEEASGAGRRRRRISGSVIDHCRALGIVTAAFYVLGFPQDTGSRLRATIDYAIELGSTVAQFKLLTPYPATPLWKQLAPRVYETRLGEVRRLHADLRRIRT